MKLCRCQSEGRRHGAWLPPMGTLAFAEPKAQRLISLKHEIPANLEVFLRAAGVSNCIKIRKVVAYTTDTFVVPDIIRLFRSISSELPSV